MEPILDFPSIDDKTVRSCEPNSLKAVISAVEKLSFKFPYDRIKARLVEVSANEPVEDKEYPGNYSRTFFVKIGFYIRIQWYFSKIEVIFNYAPEGCMNTDVQIISIGKQVGEYPNSKFEELIKEQRKAPCPGVMTKMVV